MDPLQIVLIVLALVAIWAVVELAITLRRARTSVDSLDKTMDEVNGALSEARPVIAKLDETIDSLQPALDQLEPLLKQGNIAIEALSADLLEVNGVLRDVSQVTGSVSSASGAVTGIAAAASEKVQKFFGHKGTGERAFDRTLADGEAQQPEAAQAHADNDAEDARKDDAAPERGESHPAEERQYYTYSDGVDDNANNEEA